MKIWRIYKLNVDVYKQVRVERLLWSTDGSHMDRNMFSVCWTVCFHMRMWFCVYVYAIHRLLVSTMSDMSISNIPCCTVCEPQAAAVTHISPLPVFASSTTISPSPRCGLLLFK